MMAYARGTSVSEISTHFASWATCSNFIHFEATYLLILHFTSVKCFNFSVVMGIVTEGKVSEELPTDLNFSLNGFPRRFADVADGFERVIASV